MVLNATRDKVPFVIFEPLTTYLVNEALQKTEKEITKSQLLFEIKRSKCTCIFMSKPVLSSTVLNGHPLLSGQLQKSLKFLLLTTLNVTSIKRSPLLSGRSHLLQSPSKGISIVFTCIKRSLH